jgi:hypothetical protein
MLNLTRRKDGQWRALRNDEIAIRHERGGLFELAHIDRRQLAAFRLRGGEIERRLAEDGLTRDTATSEQTQQATLQSRPRKEATDREALFAERQTRAREVGIDFARRDGPVLERPPPARACPARPRSRVWTRVRGGASATPSTT